MWKPRAVLITGSGYAVLTITTLLVDDMLVKLGVKLKQEQGVGGGEDVLRHQKGLLMAT